LIDIYLMEAVLPALLLTSIQMSETYERYSRLSNERCTGINFLRAEHEYGCLLDEVINDDRFKERYIN